MEEEKQQLSDERAAVNFFDKFCQARGPIGWYSRYVINTGRWYTNMLITEGKISSEDVILDVGCGSASTLLGLFKRIPFKQKLYGVEPSMAQLKLAEKSLEEGDLNKKIDIRRSFAASLPFEDNFFDLVYSSFIIKHLKDETLGRFFDEAYRVLKPGGRFLSWEISELTSWLLRWLSKNPEHTWQKLRYFAEVKSFLVKAGFKSVEEFYVPRRGLWDPIVRNVGFRAIK